MGYFRYLLYPFQLIQLDFDERPPFGVNRSILHIVRIFIKGQAFEFIEQKQVLIVTAIQTTYITILINKQVHLLNMILFLLACTFYSMVAY